MTMSAADFLDQWFETDAAQGHDVRVGIIGTYQGVRSPGTAYVLLHHYMGEIDGAFRAWGIPRGGTGGVSEAIASSARAFGAEIRTEAPVAHITVRERPRHGRGAGVGRGDRRRRGPRLDRCQGDLPGPAGVGHAGAASSRSPSASSGSGARRARSTWRSTGCPTSPACRARGSTCGAPSASRPRWTTWSRRTTTRRPGASAAGRTWTWSSRPWSTRAWRRPASTSSAASSSTRRTSWPRATWDDQREAFGDAVVDTLAERAPNIREPDPRIARC